MSVITADVPERSGSRLAETCGGGSRVALSIFAGVISHSAANAAITWLEHPRHAR